MTDTATTHAATNTAAVSHHAINWFEIPTTDLERAATFYEKLFDRKIRREHFGEPMAIFMSSKEGVGGTLVQRADQSPSDSGVLIYLNADGILGAAVARVSKSAARRFDYVREDGQRTRDRHARPLALYFWSGVWTLISWCELRDDFRTFRLDRMDGPQVLDRTFALKPGQRLADYLERVLPPNAASRSRVRSASKA